MDRQFGLPVAFAAAAHAALLFAFDKDPRGAAPKLADTITFEYTPIPLEPPEPVEVEASSEKSARDAAPDVPLPGLVEPLVLDLGDRPEMAPPPIRDVAASDLKSVLDGTIGALGDGEGASWGKDILGSISLDNPPRTRFQPAPIYPFENKLNGVRGEVMVEFVVDEAGLVRDPRVVSSSDRGFEEATLRAVAKWRFEPGRRHGRLVAFKMAVPVVFHLND